MGQQKPEFNDLSTRNSTFYYKVLMNFANSDVFPPLTRKFIKDDLVSPDLTVHFGWTLGMCWTAAVFAFISFVLFVLAKCCPLPQQPPDEESPTLGAASTVKSKSVVNSQGPQYGSVKES